MAHPNGGANQIIGMNHRFTDAVTKIRTYGNQTFTSTTGETICASLGKTRNGLPAIIYTGKNSIHGNVCSKCWGFRVSCNGVLIGQCTETFDRGL
ncbi:MAG: hypothetical protein A2452_06825 [Candidatus Firestonebacteria bacterium RIFOXYC2_FULL_39_67]|nr:MAG: hypothetical protein A2328_01850 [Bdellovibrionales bacterium RIFOXYB2_FULL_36_6]OGF53512.1 MAG: hypothetical protein A2452_06825 [Candidatus Firestonebacteria bacterium RIFOXYC2_FULL_39_67]